MSMKTKGILLAAGGASLWGGSGAAAQQLFMTHAVTTEWLVAVRLLGAGLLLLIWGLIKSSKQINEIIHDRKNMAMVLAFAIFGVMNSQLSYFFAIKYSNAPTATVLQYLQPVLIVLWMAFGQKIRPRRVDGISIVVALMGTFLLFRYTNSNSNCVSLGIMECSCCYIIYITSKWIVEKIRCDGSMWASDVC